VDGLDVASRTSSFGFKGQESLGMRVIAQRLGVRHVLEGSVRRSGNAIRITAQLIDAEVDRHLWSETYDRPLTAENVFAIQEEIATSIVAALVESLGMEMGGAGLALAKPTANLTAYDLYLRARSLFQARIDMDVADGLLAQALEQDPEFAKAWELRAALHALMGTYGYSDLSQDDLDELSLEYAQRALAVEPESGMALASMAHIRAMAAARLSARHDLSAIIRDLERAIGIEPNNSSALNWLAITLAHVGRLGESLDTFRRCMEVDPLFAPCAENEYELLWVMGRADEAWENFQRSLRRGVVTQTYVNFALLAHFHQDDMFMFAANQSVWLPGWRRHDEIYAAYRNLEADHTQLVGEILRFADLDGKRPTGFVENLLVPLGAYDLMPFAMLIWGPDYAGYRRSPQFDNYVRQSGVLEYWQAHGFPPQCRPAGADGFECD
jgi:Tfp pilus assembly protein PilF